MAASVANAIGKDGNLTLALAEGAGTRLAVMFTPEEATALGDQLNDRVQSGSLLGDRLLVQDERGMPFVLVEDHVGRHLGQRAAQLHEPVDVPGDPPVQRQRHLQPFEVFQLKLFDLAAFIEAQEEHFQAHDADESDQQEHDHQSQQEIQAQPGGLGHQPPAGTPGASGSRRPRSGGNRRGVAETDRRDSCNCPGRGRAEYIRFLNGQDHLRIGHQGNYGNPSHGP
jgi:hypothetical protein